MAVAYGYAPGKSDQDKRLEAMFRRRKLPNTSLVDQSSIENLCDSIMMVTHDSATAEHAARTHKRNEGWLG